ncbi:MAG: VTT domain-containing protein [Acidobacteriota bacterium]
MTLFFWLAAATLISEDLACIAAGVLVAQGQISFLPATLACFAGISLGDLLLYAAGRFLGRPALKRAPLKWFVQESDLERSSAWFSRQGSKVLFASRFLPGSRLPSYVAAGLLGSRFKTFAIIIVAAGAAWTPLLVALSATLGGEVVRSAMLQGQHLVVRLGLAALLVYGVARFAVRLSSFEGRRMLVSRWRRTVGWEFWSSWLLYVPVAFYLAYLALKHRSLTLFTAANPAMPAGGVIGESKSAILQGLSQAGRFVARFVTLEPAAALPQRLLAVQAFMKDNRLSFPVVLKPDVGQRGLGVAIVRSQEQVKDYLEHSSGRTILQEYVPGAEFGVFYVRYPDQPKGRIFSITEKRFPSVAGDGHSSLRQLILRDKRAVCAARTYLERHANRLWEVPKAGEMIPLVELGTHCRGALFLDGGWVWTETLEKAIDEISRHYKGFYFGRYDIRVPSLADFQQGRAFKIVELNGVTSEATHIYDPANSLLQAYRVLLTQWQMAFEIGHQNRQHGCRPVPLRELIRLVLAFQQQAHTSSSSQPALLPRLSPDPATTAGSRLPTRS